MKRTNNQNEYATTGNQRFSILPAAAVADNRLSSAQLRTLAALGIFGDRDGWCWPSLARLAAMVHKSRQAVSRDIQALADLGYIQIHPQFDSDGDGRRLVNRIRILFDAPCQLQVDTLSTKLVDTLSTSLVDAPSTKLVDVNAPVLTPQYNDTARAQPPPPPPPVSDDQPDDYMRMVEAIEQVIGVRLPIGEAETNAINEFIRMGVTADDIRDAVAYKRGQGRAVLSAAYMLPSVRTAVAKRRQARVTGSSSASKSGMPIVPEVYTAAQKQAAAREKILADIAALNAQEAAANGY